MTLDVRALARELDDLNERHADPLDGEPLDDEECERRNALIKLTDDLGGDLHIFVNQNGSLVEEKEKKDIAYQAAEDMGVEIEGWPGTCIDWDEATDQYFDDWTCIEFDGDTYYTRDV